MNGKRWHWIAILLAGSPVYSHAAPSCQRSDMPNWAIKAILAYPKPNERPAMLVAALAEYYDTSSIAAVDVDTVLVELAPSMLKAKTSDELRANIGRTMALFHCGSSNAVAAVAAVAPTAQKPTAAPGRDGAVVASLPVAKPADGSLKALPTKSLDGLADSADTESRSDQLDTLVAASNEALGELETNVGVMADLSAHNCSQANGGAGAGRQEGSNCLAALTDRLAKANTKSYHVISEANKVATAPGASGAAAEHIKSDFDAAQDLARQSISIAQARLPRYGLYVGPTYSLSNDGSWKSGGEFVARFESAALDHVSFLCPSLAAWCRTGSEFSYRTLAALDKPNATTSAIAADGVAKADEASVNPFAESGGIFRYTGALQVHMNDTFGAMGLLGMTALKTDTTDGVRTRPRFGLGAHFQTLYGDGALGQLFAGYVNDRIWDRPVPIDRADPDGPTRTQKNYDRWVIDGLFFIPDIDVGGFQLVARLTADSPINRRGPSDVRASLLLHHDLNGWISGVANPKKNE